MPQDPEKLDFLITAPNVAPFDSEIKIEPGALDIVNHAVDGSTPDYVQMAP